MDIQWLGVFRTFGDNILTFAPERSEFYKPSFVNTHGSEIFRYSTWGVLWLRLIGREARTKRFIGATEASGWGWVYMYGSPGSGGNIW